MTCRLPSWSRIAFATLVVMLLGLDTAPSAPARPERGQAPDPEEVLLLEEFQSWLFDARPLRGEVDLASALRDRSRSFELFREYPSPDSSRAFLRRLPWGSEIEVAAERHRVDSLLVAALVQVESSFDASARSPKGALGLMQVTPQTAATFGVEDPLDPTVNLDLGTRYLSRLLRAYDGDLELALAAYNAGPGNVRRYGGVPPFRETRRYVKKVLAGYLENCRELWLAEGSDELLELG